MAAIQNETVLSDSMSDLESISKELVAQIQTNTKVEIKGLIKRLAQIVEVLKSTASTSGCWCRSRPRENVSRKNVLTEEGEKLIFINLESETGQKTVAQL